MKTHFFAGPGSNDDIEQSPCGTWLGEGSNLSGDWSRIDCIRCIRSKTKIMSSVSAEEDAIVQQMGEMAEFMRKIRSN